MTITRSRLFLIVALICFILAALLDGGVVPGGGFSWLMPGGLASLTLAFLLP